MSRNVTNSRRTFIRRISLSFGILALGHGTILTRQKKGLSPSAPREVPPAPIDLRHSPSEWRSLTSWPNSEMKSLSGPFIGSAGTYRGSGNADLASPPLILSGPDGAPAASISQALEAPGAAIVVTTSTFGDRKVVATQFMTEFEDEGKVENIIVTAAEGSTLPSLTIRAAGDVQFSFETEEEDDVPGGVFSTLNGPDGLILLAAGKLSESSAAPAAGGKASKSFSLAPGSEGAGLFIRIPLEGQEADDLESGLEDPAGMLESARARWKSWLAERGAGGFALAGRYGDFAVASARVIDQVSPSPGPPASTGGKPEPGADGGRPPQSPPDVLFEHAAAEAERYAGRPADARARVERVWNAQSSSGAIAGAGGEYAYAETAIAIIMLIRDAELSGDWSLFHELYPDAHGAFKILEGKRDAGRSDGSPGGGYSILTSGSPGEGWAAPAAEFCNTLWTLAASKLLLETADRFFLQRRSEVRRFYGELRAAFIAASRAEIAAHPDGFNYLPMFMKGAAGESIRPQSAQENLGRALYPGMILEKDDPIVTGYLSLMGAVAVNDMPLGTGPGAPEGCAPLAALSAARVHLWKGDPVSARRFFASFLNHASPVLTWQKLVGPLPGAAPDGRAGVQAARPGPDALASADCLRHLRETLVLEDGKVLRLIDGITPVDLPLGPMKVEGSATKWGKVTLALEQQDPKSWRLSFRREVVNEKEAPPLESIELPRQLQPLFNFDAATGTTALKNGPRVYIPGAATEFEVTWRNPRKG